MDLLDKISLYREKSPAGTSPAILVAVSGGLDSVVLTHLLRAAQVEFGIIHVNFQLRGEESDADAAFVQQLATGWGLPFHEACLSAADYAAEQGISIQMAARQLRYRFFGEICTQHGYTHLALAHHLNDAVETLLLHLSRGTGLKGLTQIWQQAGDEAVITTYRIIRPLADVPRSEIAAYAEAHHITWREDRSNATDYYARNFIRHHIMPRFLELNPNFLHTTERTLQRLSDAEANLTHLLEQHFHSADPHRLDKNRLHQLPAPRHAVHTWLMPYGFTLEQARQLAAHLSDIGLCLESPTGWRVLNDRNALLLSPPQAENAEPPAPGLLIQPDDLLVTLPAGGRLMFMPSVPDPPFPDGRSAILADIARLRYPLTLRTWKAGDVFQPFGMGGKEQKLQDFFVNHKLTRFDKEQVRVLENGDGNIIWVIGHRLDERFRIQPHTTTALKVHFEAVVKA